MAQIQFSLIKKIKIGRPEHSLTPAPLRPITSHFYLTPPLPPNIAPWNIFDNRRLTATQEIANVFNKYFVNVATDIHSSIRYSKIIFTNILPPVNIIFFLNPTDEIEAKKEVFYKKAVLKHFANFTGKQLCQSLYLKKRLWQRCFPVNFAKCVRTPLVAASE